MELSIGFKRSNYAQGLVSDIYQKLHFCWLSFYRPKGYSMTNLEKVVLPSKLLCERYTALIRELIGKTARHWGID